MASSDNYSPLEKRLQFGALIAALAAIPVVYIQSSKNHDLLIYAEIAGVVIWLFFFFEVAILTWLAEKKRQWLLSHKLEVIIVLASSPVTLLINEGDNVLTASPLLIIPRLLKISKVAKLVKIGKVAKTGKIIRKSSAISSWFEVLFGAGHAMIYYAALFYGMAVGGGEVEAGGKHEAVIGLGYLGGPVLALGGIWLGTGPLPVLAVVVALVLGLAWRRVQA